MMTPLTNDIHFIMPAGFTPHSVIRDILMHFLFQGCGGCVAGTYWEHRHQT